MHIRIKIREENREHSQKVIVKENVSMHEKKIYE